LKYKIALKKLLSATLLAVFLNSFLSAENKLDFQINNNILALQATLDLNQIYDMSSYGDYYWDAAYLTKKDLSDREHYFSTGFKVASPYVLEDTFSYSLGIKAIYHPLTHSNGDSLNYIALPIGAGLLYNYNQDINAMANIYYATQVLTLSDDSPSYFEYTLQIRYRILETSFIYLGTQSKIMYFSSNDDISLMVPIFLGVQFSF